MPLLTLCLFLRPKCITLVDLLLKEMENKYSKSFDIFHPQLYTPALSASVSHTTFRKSIIFPQSSNPTNIFRKLLYGFSGHITSKTIR